MLNPDGGNCSRCVADLVRRDVTGKWAGGWGEIKARRGIEGWRRVMGRGGESNDGV